MQYINVTIFACLQYVIMHNLNYNKYLVYLQYMLLSLFDMTAYTYGLMEMKSFTVFVPNYLNYAFIRVCFLHLNLRIFE